jgi:hypothetical protein
MFEALVERLREAEGDEKEMTTAARRRTSPGGSSSDIGRYGPPAATHSSVTGSMHEPASETTPQSRWINWTGAKRAEPWCALSIAVLSQALRDSRRALERGISRPGN